MTVIQGQRKKCINAPRKKKKDLTYCSGQKSPVDPLDVMDSWSREGPGPTQAAKFGSTMQANEVYDISSWPMRTHTRKIPSSKVWCPQLRLIKTCILSRLLLLRLQAFRSRTGGEIFATLRGALLSNKYVPHASECRSLNPWQPPAGIEKN